MSEKRVEDAQNRPSNVLNKQAPGPNVSELSLNSYRTPIVTRNMKGSTGWVHSPAMFNPLILTQRDFVDVAKARGMDVSRFRDIEFVRAGRRKGTSEIYLWPTTADDPDRIEVSHGETSVWINLISLLAKEKMTIDPGYRERYVVRVVGADSPAGHAIMFDMSQFTQRKGTGSSKKDQSSTRKKEPKAAPAADAAQPGDPQPDAAPSAGTPAEGSSQSA